MQSCVTHRKEECNRATLVEIVFGGSPKLLRFFLNPEKTELNFGDRKTTLKMADGHFEANHYVLLRLALDIWLGGPAHAKALEISLLSPSEIENLISVFILLRTAKGCKCTNCTRRLGADDESLRFLSYGRL